MLLLLLKLAERDEVLQDARLRCGRPNPVRFAENLLDLRVGDKLVDLVHRFEQAGLSEPCRSLRLLLLELRIAALPLLPFAHDRKGSLLFLLPLLGVILFRFVPLNCLPALRQNPAAGSDERLSIHLGGDAGLHVLVVRHEEGEVATSAVTGVLTRPIRSGPLS